MFIKLTSSDILDQYLYSLLMYFEARRLQIFYLPVQSMVLVGFLLLTSPLDMSTLIPSEQNYINRELQSSGHISGSLQLMIPERDNLQTSYRKSKKCKIEPIKAKKKTCLV